MTSRESVIRLMQDGKARSVKDVVRDAYVVEGYARTVLRSLVKAGELRAEPGYCLIGNGVRSRPPMLYRKVLK